MSELSDYHVLGRTHKVHRSGAVRDQITAIAGVLMIVVGGATWGLVTTQLKAKLAADGLNKDEVAKNPDVLALAATRDSTMTGSFLRASLFTSVISYGVAALAMGLGVLFALLGFALVKISATTVITSGSPRAATGIQCEL